MEHKRIDFQIEDLKLRKNALDQEKFKFGLGFSFFIPK